MNKQQRHQSKQLLRVSPPTARSEPPLLQQCKHSTSFKQLQLQNNQLHKKLELKVNRIKELKDTLNSMSKENTSTNNLPTPEAKHRPLKLETVEGIIQAQAVTKNTLEGYRRLQRQFSDYRKDTASRIEHLQSQVALLEDQNTRFQRSIRQNQQEVRSRERMQILDWKSKCAELEQQLFACRSIKGLLETRVEQLLGQITAAKQENFALQQELLDTKMQAQEKERQYRDNLGEITQRLDHLSPQAITPEMMSQLELLQERYAALLSKYTRKKLRTRQLNRQWRLVTEQLLLRCSKKNVTGQSPV